MIWLIIQMGWSGLCGGVNSITVEFKFLISFPRAATGKSFSPRLCAEGKALEKHSISEHSSTLFCVYWRRARTLFSLHSDSIDSLNYDEKYPTVY